MFFLFTTLFFHEYYVYVKHSGILINYLLLPLEKFLPTLFSLYSGIEKKTADMHIEIVLAIIDKSLVSLNS